MTTLSTTKGGDKNPSPKRFLYTPLYRLSSEDKKKPLGQVSETARGLFAALERQEIHKA
jgi:hypothetical protein